MIIATQIKDILSSITEEYPDIFEQKMTDDEKLSMLTSESMLALEFVISLEDEFSIEFDDDEIDMNFFNNLKTLTSIIEKYL